MSDTLWQRGCTQLDAELPDQQFNTCIRPLPPAEVSAATDAAGSTVVSLRVPNRFKLDWIRSQYAARIEGVMAGVDVCLNSKPIRCGPLWISRSSSAPSWVRQKWKDRRRMYLFITFDTVGYTPLAAVDEQ